MVKESGGFSLSRLSVTEEFPHDGDTREIRIVWILAPPQKGCQQTTLNVERVFYSKSGLGVRVELDSVIFDELRA
jgi:hypothetical protein